MTHRTHFFSVFFGVGIALVAGLGLGRVYMNAHPEISDAVAAYKNTDTVSSENIVVSDQQQLVALQQELAKLTMLKQGLLEASELERKMLLEKYQVDLFERILEKLETLKDSRSNNKEESSFLGSVASGVLGKCKTAVEWVLLLGMLDIMQSMVTGFYISPCVYKALTWYKSLDTSMLKPIENVDQMSAFWRTLYAYIPTKLVSIGLKK